jgi:hypothetical protein
VIRAAVIVIVINRGAPVGQFSTFASTIQIVNDLENYCPRLAYPSRITTALPNDGLEAFLFGSPPYTRSAVGASDAPCRMRWPNQP